MSKSKINFDVTNGNLFRALAGEDHISALVFDVTTYPSSTTNTGANGDVYEIFSPKDAEDLGFKPFDADNIPGNYEGGVPYYHIQEFFRINPNGHLFVGVRDMATDGDFSFLNTVQTAAQGKIRQMGVYTRQEQFTLPAVGTDPYVASLIGAVQTAAEADAALNKPYSVVLHASIAEVGGEQVDITRLPTVIGSNDRVTVQIGQGNSDTIKLMQGNNTNKATIGAVGSAIGCLSLASVHESIGWVSKFDIGGTDLDTVALGFGDTADAGASDVRLTDNTPLETVAEAKQDDLDNLGYVFPTKYFGRAGTYFSSDQTCSDGDYRTIFRNRTIDKSRRLVRASLLPTLNQPLYGSADGKVSVSTIQQFKSIVSFQLSEMRKALEVSSFRVEIDPSQDILATDKLEIKYRIQPVGVNKQVDVEIGLTASTN